MSSVDYHYTLEQATGGTIRQAMHPGTTIRRDCIEKNGLNVTDAARILGVDRQTLSNLLNARSGISPEMAVRGKGVRYASPRMADPAARL